MCQDLSEGCCEHPFQLPSGRLRHILESCPHSGLEHSTQVILAEGTAQLTEHFKAQPDRLLQDMMTLPAEEHTFVSILNADPILEAVDEFCAQFAMD